MINNCVAAIQVNATASVAENLRTVERLVGVAVKAGAKFIALPENVALVGKNEADKLQHAEEFGKGLIQDFFSNLANRHKVWLIGGNLPVKIKKEVFEEKEDQEGQKEKNKFALCHFGCIGVEMRMKFVDG